MPVDKRGVWLRKLAIWAICSFGCKVLATGVHSFLVHTVPVCSKGFFRSRGFRKPRSFRPRHAGMDCHHSKGKHLQCFPAISECVCFFLFRFCFQTLNLCMEQRCNFAMFFLISKMIHGAARLSLGWEDREVITLEMGQGGGKRSSGAKDFGKQSF